MRNLARSLCWTAVTAAFLVAAPLCAAPIQIIVDTSSLNGVASDLAFDLIDGGAPANTVTISGFTTDGALGAASSTGDVTGTFPGAVTLGDASFFNEYLQNVTLGNSLRFIFDTTGNPADPASFPDGFSLFFLDPATGLPLFPTSDPTGADALFLYSIGSEVPLEIYRSDAVTVRAQAPNAIPAPATLALLLGGFLALGMLRSTRNGAS